MAEGKLDVRSQQAWKHELGFRKGLVQIHGSDFENLFPAEGQELFSNGSGFFGSSLNLIEIHARGRFSRERTIQQFRATAEDHQHVVEVVGYTASETPQHFHFLSLAHLGLQTFALSDVFENFHRRDQFAVFIEHGSRVNVHVAFLSLAICAKYFKSWNSPAEPNFLTDP